MITEGAGQKGISRLAQRHITGSQSFRLLCPKGSCFSRDGSRFIRIVMKGNYHLLDDARLWNIFVGSDLRVESLFKS